MDYGLVDLSGLLRNLVFPCAEDAKLNFLMFTALSCKLLVLGCFYALKLKTCKFAILMVHSRINQFFICLRREQYMNGLVSGILIALIITLIMFMPSSKE